MSNEESNPSLKVTDYRTVAQQEAAAEQAAPAAPAAAPQDDLVSQLEALAKLRDQGILTDEEFTAKKAQILGI
jgi:hypothetical protein